MIVQNKESWVFIFSMLFFLQAFSQILEEIDIPSPTEIKSTTKDENESATKTRSSSSEESSKQEICTIKVTSDMKGTLWVNDTSIAVDPFSLKEGKVPKNFSYYFVSEDENLITESLMAEIRPHERAKGFRLNLYMKELYDRQIRAKEAAAIEQQFLDTLSSKMVAIPGGRVEFEISKYEVTVGQFAAFIKETSYDYTRSKENNRIRYFSDGNIRTKIQKNITWRCDPMGKEYDLTEYNLPVVHVSWEDAKAFCDWLSEKDDVYVYRLPRTAEWNLAASGGNRHYKYAWGNDMQKATSYANIADKTLKDAKGIRVIQMEQEDNFVLCSPVGSFESTEYDLHDMIGNVAEWCEEKVYKGGSYATSLKDASIDTCSKEHKGFPNPSVGFRFCRVRDWK